MKGKYVVLLLFMFFLISCTNQQKQTELQDVRCLDCNLVFISIDTLRADHLGTYGYMRNTSPNIDDFASRNTVFTNFFTVVPKTLPSMTTFFSGKYVNNHGVVKNRIKVNEMLLPEILPDSFRKGGFTASGIFNKKTGFSEGFHEYVEVFNSNGVKLTDKAIEWLKQNKKNQFFLWVHYLDPHGPYRPPERLKNLFVDDPYYDESKTIAIEYEPVKGVNPSHHVLNAVPRYQRLGNNNKVDYYLRVLLITHSS